MTKNFLFVRTIGNSALRSALYFSEVVPSWGQSIECPSP